MNRCWFAVAIIITSLSNATSAAAAEVEIPEPMVFDLIRGLGAQQGEFEVNVLGQFPLSGMRGADHIEWAPEAEVEVIDGLGLEVEFPFQGGKLEAYKAAAQYTFGTGLRERFIHGTQVIAERNRDPKLWELSFLYVPAYRFNETWSAIMLVGYRRIAGGGERPHRNEALVNSTVFAKLSESMTVGLESNIKVNGKPEVEWLLMPQLHLEFTRQLSVQAGVGPQHHGGHTVAEVAVRLIFEP